MKLQPDSRKEIKRITLGTLACDGIMVAGLFLLSQFDIGNFNLIKIVLGALCGSIIADANWKGITKYPCVFLVVIARLFVVPAAVLGIFLLLGIDKQTIQSVIFYYAMPVASFLPSFLLRYNPEAVEARVAGGYMVVLSTLACVATIPIWTLLLELI